LLQTGETRRKERISAAVGETESTSISDYPGIINSKFSNGSNQKDFATGFEAGGRKSLLTQLKKRVTAVPS